MAPIDEPRHGPPLPNLQIRYELDRTGDATGFDCEMDGKFKVADTVFKEGQLRTTRPRNGKLRYTRQSRERSRGSGQL